MSSPLPAFDQVTGCLPAEPLFHDASLEDVRAALVEGFPDSASRPGIFRVYESHTEAWFPLLGGSDWEQCMDGSFVTSKLEPRDVDLVTLFAKAHIDALPEVGRTTLRELFMGSETPGGALCHAFLVPVVPEGAPEALATQVQLDYWRRWFGHQRPEHGGHAKGIVRLTAGGR